MYAAKKLSGRSIYRGLVILPSLCLASTRLHAQGCASCSDGTYVNLQTNNASKNLVIRGQDEVGTQEGNDIKVKLKENKTYEFNLVNTVPGSWFASNKAAILFGCGVEYKAGYWTDDPSVVAFWSTEWVKGCDKLVVTQITVPGSTSEDFKYVPNPNRIKVRLTPPEDDEDGNGSGGGGSPSGGSGQGTMNAQQPSFDSQVDSTGTVHDGLAAPSVYSRVPLGSVGTGPVVEGYHTAPYRTAGVLVNQGAVNSDRAKPAKFEYLGLEEVADGVNPIVKQMAYSGDGVPEKLIVTETRLFRISGFNGASEATLVDIANAENTLIREYRRDTPDETTSTTLGLEPKATKKITFIDGVLAMVESGGGETRTSSTQSPSDNVLITTDGALSKQVVVLPVDPQTDTYREEFTESRDGVALSKSVRVYKKFAVASTYVDVSTPLSDYKLVSETRFADPDTPGGGEETRYDYYLEAVPGRGIAAGDLRWVIRPDGNWTYRHSSGESYSPFASESVLDEQLSSPTDFPVTLSEGSPGLGGAGRCRLTYSSPSGGSSEWVVNYGYVDMWTGEPSDSSTPPEDVIFVEISAVHVGSSGGSGDPSTDATGAYLISSTSDGGLEVSHSYSTPSTDTRRTGDPVLEVEPNGMATFHEYLKSGNVVTRTSTTGYVDRSITTGGPIGGYTFQVVPNRSGRTIRTYGLQGLVSTEALYHTGSEFTHAYTDTEHRSDTASWTVRDGVTIRRSERVAPYTVVETDAEGRQTTTVTNELGEVLAVTVGGGGGVPPQTTTYVRNGRTTTVTGGGQPSVVSTVNGLGRTVSQTDPLGVQTTTVYPNGGRFETSTTSNGISRTRENYLDGRPKLSFGDDSVRTSYTYEAEYDWFVFDGVETTHRRQGPDDGTAGRWTASTNHDGRLIRETSPSPDPQYGEITKEYYYNWNDENRLEAVKTYGDAELVSTRRWAPFDSEASPDIASMDADVVSGSDLDLNESLSLGGLEGDRISRDEWSYEMWNDVPSRVTRRHLYPEGSAISGIITFTRQTLGYILAGNGYSQVTQIEQPSGRTTTTTRTVDPTSAAVVETMDDSATTGIDMTATVVNGYVQSVAKAGADAGKAESYAYDAFGRVKRFTDIRGASTWSFFYNDSFQLERVTNHLGQTTSYHYYPATDPNAGKLHITTLPGGRTTETSYNTRGQTTDVTGTGTYHLTYGYNSYGDRTSLTTYRGSTGSDLTQWVYNPATGLLERKVYADNKDVDYTYTWDGKPATRTSARNVVTTWTYEPLSRDLTHIAYAGDGDLTPDLTISGHDHLGRPAQVVENLNGVSRNQALSYQPSSGAVSINYAADHPWLAHVSVAQTADDSFGRPTGFGVNKGTSTVNSQAYTYDSLSRLYTVSSADLSATMTYWSGTETLHTLTVADVQNSNQPSLQRVQSIDMLGRVFGMVNRAPGSGAGSALATVSSVGHTYDAAGRRDDAKREDGTWWDYSYNNRSEIEGAVKKTSADALVPGLSFGYQYDGIGNRELASYGTGLLDFDALPTPPVSSDPNISILDYRPNNLNQYDQLTHPGTFDLLTRANAAITATADQATVQDTTTEGNLHGTRLAAANSTTGKLVTTTVSLNGDSSIAKTWVPKANVTPVYDNDGNLTNDGRWSYTWDGENRLVGMTPLTANGAPNVALEFAYDFMSRRIGKKVVDNTQGSTKLLKVSYAYDHWNPVAEWHASTEGGTTTNTLRTHLWGLDLSSPANPAQGTAGFQAAGGVGGLVASSWHGGSTHEYFLPGYDANGNIISWTKPDGTILQRTDYDPFGNPVSAERLASSAELSHLPDYGFSTKPRDAETGLLYYGFRYYDTVNGRWITKDPIEEKGGVNLCGFVNNNGISQFDGLGLWTEVQRKGDRWAITCSEEGDTWDDLAQKLRLRNSEANKWVKNYDGENPTEGREYKVPNTIPVYTSNSTKWVSDSILSVANKYRQAAKSYADAREEEGYKVIRKFQSNDRDAFISLWNEKGIYKIYFAGHGNKTDGYAAAQGPDLFVNASMVSPPYELSTIYAMHCFSLDKQDADGTNPDGTPQYVDWTMHALLTWGFHGYATHLDLPAAVFRK